MRKLTVICVLLLIAGTASAAMTYERVVVDNSAALPPGWVTQDLVITTDVDWTSSVLIVEPLEAGDIYQDAMGLGCPEPNPLFFPTFASLEFDSYVRDFNLDGSPPATGAPVDFGYTAIICDENAIAILWYRDSTDDIGTSPLARVTLKETSGGTWYFNAWDANGPAVEASGPIEGGHMIPEPATMTLLVLGGIGALIRRRRK